MSLAQVDGREKAPIPTFESKAQEKAWLQQFDAVVRNSSAFINVHENLTAEAAKKKWRLDPNRRMLKHMATSDDVVHRWVADLAGHFILIEVDQDGLVQNLPETGDTVFSVVVTDLSVWAPIEGDADTLFWFPATVAGTNQIIKSFRSYSPEEDMDEGGLVAKRAGDTSGVRHVDDNFAIVTINGEEVPHYKNDDGKWFDDPVLASGMDLIRTNKVRRRDVLSYYDPELKTFGPGYDGRRSRWPYRDMSWRTRNTGYDGFGPMSWLPSVPVAYYPSQQVWGGGWGIGLGGGFGINLGWGFSSGWGMPCYSSWHWYATRYNPFMFSPMARPGGYGGGWNNWVMGGGGGFGHNDPYYRSADVGGYGDEFTMASAGYEKSVPMSSLGTTQAASTQTDRGTSRGPGVDKSAPATDKKGRALARVFGEQGGKNRQNVRSEHDGTTISAPERNLANLFDRQTKKPSVLPTPPTPPKDNTLSDRGNGSSIGSSGPRTRPEGGRVERPTTTRPSKGERLDTRPSGRDNIVVRPPATPPATKPSRDVQQTRPAPRPSRETVTSPTRPNRGDGNVYQQRPQSRPQARPSTSSQPSMSTPPVNRGGGGMVRGGGMSRQPSVSPRGAGMRGAGMRGGGGMPTRGASAPSRGR